MTLIHQDRSSPGTPSHGSGDPNVVRYVLALPRWDTMWEIKTGRGGWPVVNPKTGKVRRHRKVWDTLTGNSRPGHWAQRHTAVKEVIDAVTTVAVAARLRPCRYMDVTLVWSPGHHRVADEDNLYPLLKICCDALARGPRKDLPGLRLVADDDSRYMRKTPRIDRPPIRAGLWLEVVAMEEHRYTEVNDVIYKLATNIH
jgi:crossover junction endodeoxyribonuclease RusA